jgi:hypothetical protein
MLVFEAPPTWSVRYDPAQGCDLALTFYPGAIEAFDRAIVADPIFSLAYAAKTQVLILWRSRTPRPSARHRRLARRGRGFIKPDHLTP